MPLVAQSPEPQVPFQTPDSQVAFKVQMVQAALGAANAIGASRLSRHRNIRETNDIAVHMLNERSLLDQIVSRAQSFQGKGKVGRAGDGKSNRRAVDAENKVCSRGSQRRIRTTHPAGFPTK